MTFLSPSPRGFFGSVALGGYALAWPRARRLVDSPVPTSAPWGNSQSTTPTWSPGWLGCRCWCSCLSLRTAFSGPSHRGINQTYGHADGLRDLVTYLALSVVAGSILMYHLRFARTLREPLGDMGSLERIEPPPEVG